jgi:solute carrier family 25 carnitine/acylcarnitine transporter 20/29
MGEAIKSFLAGWVGGAGIIAVGHPFDTIKTRLQAAPELYNKGALDCLKSTIKKEGPLTLYKGAIPLLTGIGPVFALYFAAYDSAERYIRKAKSIPAGKSLTMPQIMLCGGATGVVGSLILGPAELLKVRQQTAFAKGLDGSTMAVFKTIAKEGPMGFTKGLGATMYRDVPASMAWFGAYEMVKVAICKDPKKPAALESLFAGGCAGIANWLIALPMDTVKTQLQAATDGQKRSFGGVAAAIYSKGGVSAFYRGFVPVILRAFPANAACFACKEAAMKFFDKLW